MNNLYEILLDVNLSPNTETNKLPQIINRITYLIKTIFRTLIFSPAETL